MAHHNKSHERLGHITQKLPIIQDKNIRAHQRRNAAFAATRNQNLPKSSVSNSNNEKSEPQSRYDPEITKTENSAKTQNTVFSHNEHTGVSPTTSSSQTANTSSTASQKPSFNSNSLERTSKFSHKESLSLAARPFIVESGNESVAGTGNAVSDYSRAMDETRARHESRLSSSHSTVSNTQGHASYNQQSPSVKDVANMDVRSGSDAHQVASTSSILNTLLQRNTNISAQINSAGLNCTHSDSPQIPFATFDGSVGNDAAVDFRSWCFDGQVCDLN